MGRTKRQYYIVRLFVLALCLLLAFPVLSGRVYALSGKTGGLSWSLTGGTLRISGTGAMPDYTDANMAPWYDAATAINRIVVEEGVTSVGNLAFYGCSTTRRAALPSTVTSIGDRAFKNCTALTWVSLPKRLESIGNAAFERCEALNGILLPESLRSIGNYAFERCTSLSSIVIPSGVTRLGAVVFYHCTGLARAELRCPVEKLPDAFFYGCTGLAEVYIPQTVIETGNQAFSGCERLNTVFYSGAAEEKIADAVHADTGSSYAELLDNDGDTGSSRTTSTATDMETGATTSVRVTVTEVAVITETVKTEYTYTIGEEQVTFADAMEAVKDETVRVEVAPQSQAAVSATVSGSDGWKAVANSAKTVASRNGSAVKVQVQLTDSAVSKADLARLAGVNTQLEVTTPEGCVWVIDTSAQRAAQMGGEEIDLSFAVQLQESEVKGIDSGTVYQVSFASDVNFDVTVGVPLKTANAWQYATVYQKEGAKVTEVTSVVVDETGCAWIPVQSVSRDTDYYVAINAEGAYTANAIIPDSLKESYGVDYFETLTDAAGNRYEVGERESRWGITGKQFTIYAVIVVAALVFIVTGVMITLNRINRSKAKYAAMAEDNSAEDYDIDEDELRLQIMQEMLEEARREKEGR